MPSTSIVVGLRPDALGRRLGIAALALTIVGTAACDGEAPAVIAFGLDEAAFGAPPPPGFVPFDVVAADMDLDGDPDVLVNWHNLARLELYENDGGSFRLLNPRGDDRSGLFENPGVPDLYAPEAEMLERAREAAAPGVFVWHDPGGREDWNFYVVPGDRPVRLTLRANRELTLRLDERFVRRRGELDAELVFAEPVHFRANVDYVATQLKVRASLPLYVGPQMRRFENGEADLWKDDPHGIAWVDVRGTPEPDIFITRGGLMGTLQPPHDPKVDRFFEYAAAELLYADVRGEVPGGYGRGRRVEWVDIDGDMASELYIGNTETPNVLLAAGGGAAGDGEAVAARGGYRDIAPSLGLDFRDGDTFVWLDVDGNGLDDLVFVGAGGFEVAYNRGARSFEVRPGHEIGLVFPAGSEPRRQELFDTLSLYVLDYDNDGRLDLWLFGHGEERGQALYRASEDTGDRPAAGTPAPRRFSDVTAEVGLDTVADVNSAIILDLDNDGYLDAITIGLVPRRLHNVAGAGAPLDDGQRTSADGQGTSADGQRRISANDRQRTSADDRQGTSGNAGPSRLTGGRRFQAADFHPEWELQAYTRGVAADVDLDGRLDVVLVGDRRLLARNTSSGVGSALRVVPRAEGGDPVGTLVTAFYADGTRRAQRYGSANVTQYSQGLLPLHFGVRAGVAIERLVVRWPDGRVETRTVSAGEDLIELRHRER